MKVLVAPNAFKGCLSAPQAARAMAAGVRAAVPGAEIRLVPLADGGDGTLDILSMAMGAGLRFARVRGPLGRPVRAAWAYHRKSRLAIVEMAKASGVALVPPHQRNPFRTTSFGAGQLIKTALSAGARTVFLTVGGSATVDGGLGALQALGAKVRVRRKAAEELLTTPATGADLARLSGIDADNLNPRLLAARLILLCDVSSPLLGPRGAARVYGPQKGATPRQVERLEAGLGRLARIVREKTGINAAARPGAGAAGGLPAAFAGFVKGRIQRGAEVVGEHIQLERWVRWADVVITGEGEVDSTSAQGKAAGTLARLCRRRRKPLYILTGRAKRGAEKLLAIASPLTKIDPPLLTKTDPRKLFPA